MYRNLTRRTFVTTALSGIGAVALNNTIEFAIETDKLKTAISQGKQLYATTDFSDNIIINHRGNRYGNPVGRTPDYYANHRCFMNIDQLNQLHKYLASLG